MIAAASEVVSKACAQQEEITSGRWVVRAEFSSQFWETIPLQPQPTGHSLDLLPSLSVSSVASSDLSDHCDGLVAVAFEETSAIHSSIRSTLVLLVFVLFAFTTKNNDWYRGSRMG